LNPERIVGWLQVIGNLGIVGGLVLVGFQLQQNSEILKTQVIVGESQSVINQELQIVGENGAAVWAKAMTDPMNLSYEEHRIMESIYWSQLEGWANLVRLQRLGLVEVEGEFRAAQEAPFFFGNTYGRAWWNVRRDIVSNPLRKAIDQQLSDRPNFTLDIQDRLEAELKRIARQENADLH